MGFIKNTAEKYGRLKERVRDAPAAIERRAYAAEERAAEGKKASDGYMYGYHAAKEGVLKAYRGYKEDDRYLKEQTIKRREARKERNRENLARVEQETRNTKKIDRAYGYSTQKKANKKLFVQTTWGKPRARLPPSRGAGGYGKGKNTRRTFSDIDAEFQDLMW